MKAIIYAGIGLFSAASLYGVVDYYTTKNKGALDKMCKEEEPAVINKKESANTISMPAVAESEPKIIETNNKTTDAKASKKKLKKYKREFKFSEFSRGRIMPREVTEEIKETEPAKEEKKQ
jgi:hypothetical protein